MIIIFFCNCNKKIFDFLKVLNIKILVDGSCSTTIIINYVNYNY